MPIKVGKALLHNSEDRELHLFGQILKGLRDGAEITQSFRSINCCNPAR